MVDVEVSRNKIRLTDTGNEAGVRKRTESGKKHTHTHIGILGMDVGSGVLSSLSNGGATKQEPAFITDVTRGLKPSARRYFPAVMVPITRCRNYIIIWASASCYLQHTQDPPHNRFPALAKWYNGLAFDGSTNGFPSSKVARNCASSQKQFSSLPPSPPTNTTGQAAQRGKMKLFLKGSKLARAQLRKYETSAIKG